MAQTWNGASRAALPDNFRTSIHVEETSGNGIMGAPASRNNQILICRCRPEIQSRYDYRLALWKVRCLAAVVTVNGAPVRRAAGIGDDMASTESVSRVTASLPLCGMKSVPGDDQRNSTLPECHELSALTRKIISTDDKTFEQIRWR